MERKGGSNPGAQAEGGKTANAREPVDEKQPPRRLVLSSRDIAFRTALMTSGIFLLASLVSGGPEWFTLVAVVVALFAAGLVFRDQRPLRKRIAVWRKPASGLVLSPSVLISAVPDPVLLIDRRGLVNALNPAAKTMLPLLKEAQPLAFFVRAPEVLDGLETVLKGGGPVECEFLEHGAVERSFVAHIAPVGRNSQDLPEGAVLLIRDLTSARRLEHMRVDFVANASHELRTPLSSLIGFIETLQGPARNDTVARDRFLDIMRDQAHRMARLIDDLLSLSRVEMNLHVPPSGTVEIGLLVRHIVETLAPLAQDRGVTVALEVPAEPLYVTGESDDLLRVVENLVENAIKYGQEGLRVDISLRTLGPEEGHSAMVARQDIVLEVRDYGPGIASEHLPRLTERFYRGNAADSREKNGTGLGLAIVKHIVNRHRGRLDIESRLGEGAVFRVSLPRKPGGEHEM